MPPSATATLIIVPTIASTQGPNAAGQGLDEASTPHPSAESSLEAEGGQTTDDASQNVSMFSAILSEVTGSIYAMRASDSEFTKVYNAYILREGDKIKTDDNSSVRLNISNGLIVRVGPKALLTLIDDEGNSNDSFLTKLYLENGQIWVILLDGKLEAETPFGTASMKGAYLSVTVDPGAGILYITCLKGHCSLENEAGSADIVAGETASCYTNAAPPTKGRLNDDEVTRWLSFNPEATIVIDQLEATVQALPTVTPPEAGH